MRAGILAMIAALAITHGAAATTVYKCEHAGKTVYSDSPCGPGRQSEVAVDPALAPDREARATAENRASREVQRADQAVANARRRADDDARRRTEIAVADRKTEEARLRKEAAEAEKAALGRPAVKPKLAKPRKPSGFKARAPRASEPPQLSWRPFGLSAGR